MHVSMSYARRETLSDNDLERLKTALENEVSRYREAIRGYSAEKMQRYGTPFLTRLEARVRDVEQLQLQRRGP